MMSPERPNNAEELLQRYAKERREQASDLSMHPATRRMLQGEVARQFKPASAPEPARELSWLGWFGLWRARIAVGAALAAVVMGMVWVARPPAPEPSMELAKLDRLERGEKLSEAAPAEANLSKPARSLNDLTVLGDATPMDADEAKDAAAGAIAGLDAASALLAAELDFVKPRSYEEGLEARTDTPAIGPRVTFANTSTFLTNTTLYFGAAEPLSLVPQLSTQQLWFDYKVSLAQQASLPATESSLRPVSASEFPRAYALVEQRAALKAKSAADDKRQDDLSAITTQLAGAAGQNANVSTESLAYRTMPALQATPSAPESIPAQQGFLARENRPQAGALPQEPQAQPEALALLKRIANADTPEPLTTFRVEQRGDALRMIEADGSVYVGTVNQEMDLAARSAPERNETETRARRDQTARFASPLASQQQVQSFRAAGSNVTLRQSVVVQGRLLGNVATNQVWQRAGIVQMQGASRSLSVAPASPAPKDSPANGVTNTTAIEGTVRVGTNEQQFRAVPLER
jgi:hypothetical protein